jgi:hypothetical protein
VDSVLRQPGIDNFDFAIFKSFQLGERYHLQFRTEFFNLFNHPQFGPPGTGFNPTTTNGVVDTTANGFGAITDTINSPRLIQFALRFAF